MQTTASNRLSIMRTKKSIVMKRCTIWVSPTGPTWRLTISGERFSHHHLHTIIMLSGQVRLLRHQQCPTGRNKSQPAPSIKAIRQWAHHKRDPIDHLAWDQARQVHQAPIHTANSNLNSSIHNSMAIIRSNQTQSAHKVSKSRSRTTFMANDRNHCGIWLKTNIKSQLTQLHRVGLHQCSQLVLRRLLV